MKRILGLDLSTSSIGWAYVTEAENENEISEIKKIGVRVNLLNTDEQINFEKGKSNITNALRASYRGARRNLQRYKLRREHLIKLLVTNNLIIGSSQLAESGAKSTFETYTLRAKAATSKISLEDFSRVLLMINKKRGYKSSRKLYKTEDGELIDALGIAKKLYDQNLTPGQLSLELLQSGKKKLPDFYRSDLNKEFDRIWMFQQAHHPEILTPEFKELLAGKGAKATSALFWKTYAFNTAALNDNKRITLYQLRVDALSTFLSKEMVALVLSVINGQINNASGYLNAISDRSKVLYFNKQTVGQYLYKQLLDNPNTSLKSQVFYRQDYLDEFEQIWEQQAKYYPSVLSAELKEQIRDTIIFYQRKLKSQKGQISLCEFEQKEIIRDGKSFLIGSPVAPKSSPIFQEFRIWQQLHNVEITNKKTREKYPLTVKQKQYLFDELNLKGNLSNSEVLKLLKYKFKDWEINYTELEGNSTNKVLYNIFLDIIEYEGYDVRDELKIKLVKDRVELKDLEVDAAAIKDMVATIFNDLGIHTGILNFDASLKGTAFEQQESYSLWHLLYSYEEDDSSCGLVCLYKLLHKKFNFSLEQAKLFGKVIFRNEYGNLSTKAIRKIYPHITENNYETACLAAGYNQSMFSLAKEDDLKRELKSKLSFLPKSSLRNPVVEKVLNQMVNVVNALIDGENEALIEQGKVANFFFDEIHIKLARELKKCAKEREDFTKSIIQGKVEHEKIIKIIQKEDGIVSPTRNDITRYKLYQELKDNGYKDLYTNEYIERKDIFTKEYDIEHIIPQSCLFDDSLSNKTLVRRNVNLKKGNQTAYDFILVEYGTEKANEYIRRITKFYNSSKQGGICKSKFEKLLMTASDINEGVLERDLCNSQYIAKKVNAMLFEITRNVMSTSAGITDRLCVDWGLINVMTELNIQKYRDAGLTTFIKMKDGSKKEIITDWTKRNDHRHHAMDALVVAFTKQSHIQYLGNLNAKTNKNSKLHQVILAIQTKETHVVTDNGGVEKRVFNQPLPNFREEVKHHLEAVLVSHKTKNKVVTKSINRISGNKVGQQTLTPRGQLHKETVYGKIRKYVIKEEKVSAKFDVKTINKVANSTYKRLLLKRLFDNNNDPKKAFTGKNSLSKCPLYVHIDKQLIVVPEIVKLRWLEVDYTIRKHITPRLKVDKVIDQGTKRILEARLIEYGGDAKLAFSNLEQNPIWFNKEKEIAIKSVTISGVKNVEPLHVKKNHFGEKALDKKGNEIPIDYVSTGNNHHVAIYEDNERKLQECVASFYEVVERVNTGLPIVDKTYNQQIGWTFLYTMKQNELFLFPSDDFNPEEIDLFNKENYPIISKNLFRVQKFTNKDYFFRHHIETNVEDNSKMKNITWKRAGLGGIENIVKVRTNHLGEIIQVGEY